MTGWRKRTIMEMAKEAEFELDCVSLEWHKRIETFAKLVREDALAQPAPVQEPVGTLNIWFYKGHGNYDFDYWGSLGEGTYTAHIHKNGKQIYLGMFETAELAHQAYKENT